jgi:DNA-directed RNA polymerase subunit RPC12/RpoP
MCRYAMTTYKPHYACFECRKTFKRRLLHDVNRDEDELVAAKCPECGRLMANMGLDFKSPQKKNLKAWQHLQSLYEVGITYHSCGCSGPGYIPATTEAIVNYLEERLGSYVSELRFWLNRPQPDTKQEFERDKDRNSTHRYMLPRELQGKNGGVDSNDAVTYWQQRVHNLEHNLSKAKMRILA